MEEQNQAIDIGDFKVYVPKTKGLAEFATKVNTDPEAIDLLELERKRANAFVPTIDMRNSSYKDKRNPTGTGPYQVMIRAERVALKNGTLENLQEFNTNANTQFSRQEISDMIDFLPNARFAYLNGLMKKAMEGVAKNTKTLKRGDYEFVDTIWINEQAKKTLKAFLLPAVDMNATGFAIEPTQSRSGIKFYDAPGKGLGISMKNPGYVVPHEYPYANMRNPGVITAFNPPKIIDLELSEGILQKLDAEIVDLVEKAKIEQDVSALYSFDDPSMNLTKSLVAFRDKLMQPGMKYGEIKKIIDSLSNMVGIRSVKYLSSLANPFKVRNARIPTLLSPPSAVFSVRNINPLTTNALGNVAFCFNPYMLFNFASLSTGLTINNNALLTGTAPSPFFLGVAVGQVLPADFYTKFRLVSAGIRIYCYPSSNNDNGICTTSVTYETISNTDVGVALVGASQFGDFTQIENGYYKKTNTVASRVVQESAYLPTDEGYWDYVTLGNIRSGFAWVGYITGAMPSTTIARLETILNFEALLDNQYTDYLPSESPMTEGDPKTIFSYVARMKASDSLEPAALNDIIAEQNLSMNPEGELKLPKSREFINQNRKVLDKYVGLAKDVTKSTLDKLEPQEKNDWLGKIVNVVSPFLASIVGSVANPFSFLGPISKTLGL